MSSSAGAWAARCECSAGLLRKRLLRLQTSGAIGLRGRQVVLEADVCQAVRRAAAGKDAGTGPLGSTGRVATDER